MSLAVRPCQSSALVLHYCISYFRSPGFACEVQDQFVGIHKITGWDRNQLFRGLS